MVPVTYRRRMSLLDSLSAAFAARPDAAAVPAASIMAVVDQAEVTATWGVPEGTLFQAASISKPVAALAALQLVASGRLTLDTDINDYLVSWHLPGDAWMPPVTVRHLLCHSAALTVSGMPGYEPGQALPSLTEILDGRPPANTAAVRRAGVPGGEHCYSGGGYVVLQQLLEDVSSRPFADLAAELVFSPARMTTASYAEPEHATAAAAHVDGHEVSWHVYPEQATAGLWCTPADLVRFAQTIQASVAGEAPALLPPALAQEMVTPQVDGWGLGAAAVGRRRTSAVQPRRSQPWLSVRANRRRVRQERRGGNDRRRPGRSCDGRPARGAPRRHLVAGSANRP